MQTESTPPTEYERSISLTTHPGNLGGQRSCSNERRVGLAVGTCEHIVPSKHGECTLSKIHYSSCSLNAVA